MASVSESEWVSVLESESELGLAAAGRLNAALNRGAIAPVLNPIAFNVVVATGSWIVALGVLLALGGGSVLISRSVYAIFCISHR